MSANLPGNFQKGIVLTDRDAYFILIFEPGVLINMLYCDNYHLIVIFISKANEVNMTVKKDQGNRGTDVAFYNLMYVSGEAILKLIGINHPHKFKMKSVVLKDKQLFPDMYAWPVLDLEGDDIRVFFEFQGYKDQMIRFKAASKVTLYCAQESYTGKIQAAIIYTEKKYLDAAKPLIILNPDGEIICECSFKEIVLEDYTFEQLISIDHRLIILAPFTVSKRLKKETKISLCHEWATILRIIYPEKLHHSALDILSLFILNRFRNLSLEEVQTMLNFDISKTVAGKQLVEMGRQIGTKQGVKQGVKQGREQGVKQGRELGLMQTASKMLQKGFKPQIIKDITGLSDKDIKKLLN